MEPAIQIQNLCKEYKLAPAERYIALRDVIAGAARNLFRPAAKKQAFRALQDISLDIMPGERLGIIGRNGAGKSTLLKIISRITPPTSGKVVVRGRVGSLLEVGTGFHPELTGRENIYLNGSILGLKRSEISRQLDTIIQFSGVEKFIDSPLKRYSSGMQMRLAFSVAAHLDTEILLVDEVLAVGDAEFQKKCLGKMEEVSRQDGRTILFVSHNMDSIRKFCPSAILLDKGKITAAGLTEKVIHEYTTHHLRANAVIEWPAGVHSYNNEVMLQKAWLHDESGTVQSRFDTTEKAGISLAYEVVRDDAVFTHGINVYNQENVNVFNSHDVTSPVRSEKRKKGKYRATAWIPGNLLPEGMFSVSVALFLPNPLDVLVYEKEVLTFEIFTNFSKPSARGDYADAFPGIVRPLIQWETVKTE